MAGIHLNSIIKARWDGEKVAQDKRTIQLFQNLMLTLLLLCVFTTASFAQKTGAAHPKRFPVLVPLGGNTWPSSETSTGGAIDTTGIVNWTDKTISFSTYVRLAKTGTIKLWLQASVPGGKSIVQLRILNKSKNISLQGNATANFYAGEWNITDTGYIAISLKALSKTSSRFADVRAIKLEGTAVEENTAFVKNNEGNFFFWGRRGPSVHLNFDVPDTIHAEWYYNEVTVPKGNDMIGSYFMAVGFADGYFGMQVNSDTERRILFSVWSPFQTDNPSTIPADQKIQLLKKGEGVHAGEFGNEGSGGQSFLRYNWEAGTTYSFLLHGAPADSTHTVYTAYFFVPEQSKWLLVASFRRPKAGGYLRRFHSFLENFEPETGNQQRRVLFNNQWVCDSNGTWLEISNVRFTGDNTAVKRFRMDYAGGVSEGSFYLRNCGFFNDCVPLYSRFHRPLTGRKPVIDFSTLP